MEEGIRKFDRHFSPEVKNKASRAAKGAGMSSKSLFPDQLETLKDENINLKNRQKDLESEIKIIATKFTRQINMLKKDRFVKAGGSRSKVTHQFEEEFDKLIEENTKLQTQEKELMDKVKKLQAKRKKDLNQGKNLYNVAQSGIDKPSRQEAEQVAVIKGLQETLGKQQKKILSLTKDIESSKRLQGSAVNMDMLDTEKRTIEFKLMSAKAKLEDFKASLGVKQDIFKQSKLYQDQLHKQL